jgi:hypothetical protein
MLVNICLFDLNIKEGNGNNRIQKRSVSFAVCLFTFAIYNNIKTAQ